MARVREMVGALLTICALSCAARAEDVGVYVRIEGEAPAALRGLALVTGLPGTGDSGKELVMARPLARLLEMSDNPVNLEDLAKSRSVAVVMVSCQVPAAGGRRGDQHDITVTAIHSAKSLKGGQLIMTPLVGPLPGDPVFAMAQGELILDDPDVPTRARVRSGAQIVSDLPAPQVGSSFNLILKTPYAGRAASTAIAETINTEYYQTPNPSGPVIATALDDRTVRINVPEPELSDINGFLGLILSFRLEPSELDLPPRVVVNQASGTVVFTSDVTLSPSAISDADLTIISINPPIPPTPLNPVIEESKVTAIRPLAMSPQDDVRLSDLIAALKQLDVPVKRQIHILHALSKAGQLHAELIIE